MRLDVGSGDRPLDGWTHLDIREMDGVDIVDDATKLHKIPDGSCEALRASHVLEHFGRHETVPILSLWLSKLEPGGELELEVPNLTGWIRAWACDEVEDPALVEALFGRQDYPENFHKTMFTPRTLVEALFDAGFDPHLPITDVGRVLVAFAYRPRGDV